MGNGSRVWRGLVVSISYLLGFPRTSYQRYGSQVPRFLYI